LGKRFTGSDERDTGYDEVHMVSNEVLEANIAHLRATITDFKTDFRAAISKIDSDIGFVTARLEAGIRFWTESTDRHLEELSASVRSQLDDIRRDVYELQRCAQRQR
jgi:hypothetical protein